MKTTKLIIGFLLLSFSSVLNAAECVGVQMDNQGLVANILSFYRDPILRDWQGIDSEKCKSQKEQKSNQEVDSINQQSKLTKHTVDLKKLPSDLEKEMERVQALPPMNIPMKSCPLHAAICLCAEAANMNYIAPPKDHFKDTVTLKVHASPYAILTMLSEHYGLGMEFERGIWHFYRVNENELITRKYQLLYNNQEIVKMASPSLHKTIESTARSFSGSSPRGNSEALSINTDVIVKEIQKILSLPTTGLEAVIEFGGSVRSFSKISDPSLAGCVKSQIAPEGRVLLS